MKRITVGLAIAGLIGAGAPEMPEVEVTGPWPAVAEVPRTGTVRPGPSGAGSAGVRRIKNARRCLRRSQWVRSGVRPAIVGKVSCRTALFPR